MKTWQTPNTWHRLLFGFIGLIFLNGSYVPQLLAGESAVTDLKTGQVILSWEEMKKLLAEIETLKQDIKTLKQEQVEAQKTQTEPLPVEYSITESHFTGDVKGDSAQFKANLSVQILKEGWVTIPFFGDDVGIEAINIQLPAASDTSATSDSTATHQGVPLMLQRENVVGEQPVAQFVRDTQGYSLLAKGPTSLAIQVTFQVPILVEELTYTLALLPPRAVINHITLRIPEKGVNVVQKTSHSQVVQEEGVTTIETVLSERDTLKLGWKVEKDSGLNRKSLAVLHALASVDKSDIVVSSTIVLKHVAELKNIAFRLPLDVEILDVTSLDIEQWSTEKLVKSQVVKIAGQSDPRTAVKMDISYRLRLAALPADIAIPAVEVIGTDALEGFLGIEALGNLEVKSKPVTDGIPMPAKNLPKILWQKAANPLLYGYQFYGKAFNPSFSIRSYQEIKTVVANVDLVDCVTHRTLEGKSITRVLYFIRNNDRQFLTLTLPQNSRIWQAFLNGKPVKPAQKDSGEILIPMKKSATQGGELQSFAIEIGYITEVSKLTLKGDILNQLPAIDLPISYLRWSLYLPEFYEYSRFEGLLKQVPKFSVVAQTKPQAKPQIDIPTQGRRFLFEKHLIVDGQPYIRGKYGQFLGDDIFLSLDSDNNWNYTGGRVEQERFKADTLLNATPEAAEEPYDYNQPASPRQQITPNMF